MHRDWTLASYVVVAMRAGRTNCEPCANLRHQLISHLVVPAVQIRHEPGWSANADSSSHPNLLAA